MPHVRCDIEVRVHIASALFQSTHPVRGATGRLVCCSYHSLRFNPRAPCGARQSQTTEYVTPCTFQSTRPMRGATAKKTCQAFLANVSIHAPHAGRDGGCSLNGFCSSSFNPRAPCGARPTRPIFLISLRRFQSTRPMRGATAATLKPLLHPLFQSTRPMRGATAGA